ncbi:prepilin-type N-terminal cleavage/methylation domain-containing protein [Geminocystis sp. NIES-3709]|nr:prepilin-type N-terminal cleavage/methylation domain-containing protein [Geminocystis sp. NIES-3709]
MLKKLHRLRLWLLTKTSSDGFTLIELLIVVMIF